MAEAALREKGGKPLASANKNGGRTGWRQTRHGQKHSAKKRDLDAAVRRAEEETKTVVGGFASPGTSAANSTEHDEEYAECVSSNDSLTSLGETRPDLANNHPAEVKAGEENEAPKTTRPSTIIRGGGGFRVASEHEKTGVELAAAVEKSRASERR